MEINKLTKESTKEIIEIIVSDRLLELNRLLDEGVLKDGDEFILIDIFDKEEWNGIQHYPGNWELGRVFKTELNKSKLPIQRHHDMKLKNQGAVYVVNKKDIK